MTELFNNPTYQTVALGSGLLGAVSGGVGSLAVVRRRSLQGDAVAHAALPGVALAFWLGARDANWLVLGGAITGWFALVVVAGLTQRTKVPFDAGLAGALAVFFGFGVALMTYIRNNVKGATEHGLERYLVGQAATMRMNDVYTILASGGLAVVLIAIVWRPIKLVAFDPEYASTQGVPVRLVEWLLAGLLVLAVVVGLQAVGVVLMSALVVAPGIAARQFVNRLGPMMVLAGVLGAIAGIVGVTLSTLLSVKGRFLPTGPTIVLAATGIVLIAMAVSWAREYLNRQQSTNVVPV